MTKLVRAVRIQALTLNAPIILPQFSFCEYFREIDILCPNNCGRITSLGKNGVRKPIHVSLTIMMESSDHSCPLMVRGELSIDRKAGFVKRPSLDPSAALARAYTISL